jgi:NCAIR mutase (PurE)-related protein
LRKEDLLRLLEDVKTGSLEISAAADTLQGLSFEDIHFAKIDHHREIRRGFPEIIFCEGKTVSQLLGIARRIRERGSSVIGTRCTPEQYRALAAEMADAHYFNEARIFFISRGEIPTCTQKIAVITAGTSDIPVAEEAAVTLECLGIAAERIYDVGVAGIHRLFANLDRINGTTVVIAVAGMEGALPSVIAGLTDKPVIAVPTSIGYGTNFQGLSALLAMLNSCAGGIGVVNIDNGFGAAYLAALIIRQIDQAIGNRGMDE